MSSYIPPYTSAVPYSSTHVDPPPPSYGQNLEGPDGTRRKQRLLQWVNADILYTHTYRRRRFASWSKADYFYSEIQWLEPFTIGAGGTYRWTPLTFRPEEEDFPTPTFDEFSAPIDNEASRLGRPEYEPTVMPSGERPGPKARRGARLAEQVLTSALKEMRWPEEEDTGELHMPMYGQWFLFSFWETSYLETCKTGVESAVRCPECGLTLASAIAPADDFNRTFGEGLPGIEQLGSESPEAAKVKGPGKVGMRSVLSIRATHCPACVQEVSHQTPLTWPDGSPMMGQDGIPMMGEPMTSLAPGPALQPFHPIQDELSLTDVFGRSLSEDIPLGRWRLKTISPYDVFLPNHGLEMTMSEISEWTIVLLMSLDEIRSKWKNGHLVKAEAAGALMQFHPVAGERSVLAGAGGPGFFRNHSRVKIKCKKPWREMPQDETGRPIEDAEPVLNRGRYTVIAHDVVLEDGDLMIESSNSPGTFIPRAHLDGVIWKVRTGGKEALGISMAEGLFEPCETVNETASQYKDAMEREGSPKWLVERALNFDYDKTGDAGAQWLYDSPPDRPGVKPERVPSTLMDSQVLSWINWVQQHITRHTHLNDVETGNVPPGVSAALALQILGEQAGEHRRNRILRIREMLERVYRHGLILMHELVREPRLLWAKDDRGKESQKSWTGLDLHGQTEVRISATPEHNTPLLRQQRLKDLLDLFGDQIRQNPRAIRRIAQRYDMPIEGFEDESLQDEAAQREYCRFIDEGRPPVVDPDLDDPSIHHQQHGSDFMSEQWQDLEDEAEWDRALMYLSGWEGQFQVILQMMAMAQAQIAQAKMNGGGPMAAAMGIGGPPLTPEMVRRAQQWPRLLELQITEVWRMLLRKAEQDSSGEAAFSDALGGDIPLVKWEAMGYAQAPPLLRVLRMRAHDAAHKRAGEALQAAAGAGASVMAAPAGEATAAGTMPATPTPGTPMAEAPAQ